MRFRTKIIGAASGVMLAAMAALSALGQVPGAQVITSLLGTEYISCASCTVSAVFSSATLAAYSRSTQLLYTTTGWTGTYSGTNEQTLASYSLPGGTLNTGTKLIIRASFSAGPDSNNKTFKVYFGSATQSSGVLTTNNKSGNLQMVVTRTGTNQQIVYSSMKVDTTPITDYVNTGAGENDALAIPIYFTGTDGTSVTNDITINDFSVERLGK